MTLWVAMLVSHLWSTSWVMFPVHLQNFCSGQGCQNWCRRETVGHCCSQGYSCLLDSCQQIFHAVSELRLEPPGTDMDKLVLESLFEVCCTFLTYYWTCEDVWSLHTFCCLTKCGPNHLREFSHMLQSGMLCGFNLLTVF
jgi:hypothetical protein